MTTKEEVVSPVTTSLYATGVTSVGAVSNEALVALDLKSQPTVWAMSQGRPILDRLPSESQQYKKGYDADQAYVYLDSSTNLAIGPGTLQVARDGDDPYVLFVNDGEITWYKGQLIVPSLTVDVSQLNFGRGLDDGAYQIGYQLGAADPAATSLVPGYARATAVDSLLGSASLIFTVSSASQYYEAAQALTDEDVIGSTAWRPNSLAEAGGYSTGSWYVLDFKAPVEIQEFELKTDLKDASAKMALYSSDDAIIWNKVSEVKPNSDGWLAPVNSQPTTTNYW